MVFTVEGKRLSAEVFDADGKRIDRFSIVQEGRTYAKEYLALTKDELPLQVWFFHHGYLLLGKRDATLAKGGPLELEIIRGAGGFSDELPADMNITFAIAPQSKAHYRIEGNVVRTVFRKDQKRIRSLMMTVVPLVDVTRKGSTPKPELFLEVTYECGAIKGKLVMKPHWIWNR